MLRKIIVFFASVVCNAEDNGSFYYSTAADHCTAQHYSSLNLPCDPQSFQYKHDLDTLFGNGTSIHYDLKKNSARETVSLAANFKNDSINGQLQANYKKETAYDQKLNGSAQMYLHYRTKPFDQLTLGVSERFVFPLLDSQNDPYYFISSVHSDYSLNDSCNLFVQSSYTSFQQSYDPDAVVLHNPYTVMTGLSYANGNNTSLKASFSQNVHRDKTLDADENVNIMLNQKISSNIHSKLMFSKNISSAQYDDKAFINFNYVF